MIYKMGQNLSLRNLGLVDPQVLGICYLALFPAACIYMILWEWIATMQIVRYYGNTIYNYISDVSDIRYHNV